jgi:membrane-associated protein
MIWAGYLLGQAIPDIGRYIHVVIGIVILLSVIPIGLELWRARAHQRREAAVAPPPER